MSTKKHIAALHSNKFVWIDISDFEDLCFRLAQELRIFDQPIPEFRSRNPGILESCLKTPLQQFGSKDLYPNLLTKVAILFYLLIKNHPFPDGNKRVAVTTLLTVLYLNYLWLEVSPIRVYTFAITVSASDPRKKNIQLSAIRTFIEKYCIVRKSK